MPIAVCGYTVRYHGFNKEQVESTYKKIAEMGYDGPEGSLGRRYMSVEEDLALLNKYGLKVCDAYGDLTKPDEAMENASKYGVKVFGIGAIPGEMMISADGFKAYADRMNELAKPFEGTGFRLQYHNHSQEFRNFPELNGKTGYALLIENTNPDVIAFQLDTHWTAAAGADPAAWIRKLKGRIPIVHFKDYAIDNYSYDVGLGNVIKRFAEIGQGNINWTAVKEACEFAGVEWYSVEQDRSYMNEFDSLKISIDFMKSIGIK